jgi:hypothetical protein
MIIICINSFHWSYFQQNILVRAYGKIAKDVCGTISYPDRIHQTNAAGQGDNRGGDGTF